MGKIVTKNRAFGNNIIFLQQIFRFRGAPHCYAPAPHQDFQRMTSQVFLQMTNGQKGRKSTDGHFEKNNRKGGKYRKFQNGKSYLFLQCVVDRPIIFLTKYRLISLFCCCRHSQFEGYPSVLLHEDGKYTYWESRQKA